MLVLVRVEVVVHRQLLQGVMMMMLRWRRKAVVWLREGRQRCNSVLLLRLLLLLWFLLLRWRRGRRGRGRGVGRTSLSLDATLFAPAFALLGAVSRHVLVAHGALGDVLLNCPQLVRPVREHAARAVLAVAIGRVVIAQASFEALGTGGVARRAGGDGRPRGINIRHDPNPTWREDGSSRWLHGRVSGRTQRPGLRSFAEGMRRLHRCEE